MSSTHVNGGGDSLKASSPAGTAPKQPFKPNAGGKALDTPRKQAASPVDPQNKKQAPPQPKAWQGPNPITSRANAAANLPNGTDKPLPKPTSHASSAKAAADSHADRHAHDRLLFLLANMTGQDATITLKNGEHFAGVFSGGSFDSPSKNTYTMKMVRRTRPAGHQLNGDVDMSDEYVGEGDDHIMSFDIQDTVDLAVQDVVASSQPAQDGSIHSSFRTDAEISRHDPGMPRERELQRWEPGPNDDIQGLALEDSGSGAWDQFAANENTFNVQSSYDENIYTTSIDRSHPEYGRRLAKAERLAREIEGSSSSNLHVAEERRKDTGHDDGGDEEDKYSGVKRDYPALSRGGSGTYVPPSRRPITNQPSVSGAPYDPAIISSQLAKPTAPPAPQTAAAAEEAPEPAKAVGSPPKPDEQKTPAADTSSSKGLAAAGSASQAPKKSPIPTEDRLRDTADAFKQFANNEKLRLRQAVEQKRTNARHEKNVRINDLKKFAENFKLKSRVPDDLVPILAKDHEKQLEIKRKAETAARGEEHRSKEREKDEVPTTPALSTASQPTNTAAADQRAPLSQQPARQRAPSNRNNLVPQPIPPMTSRQPPLFNNRPQRQNGPLQPLPTDLRIPTGPALHRDAGPISPTSATRLNVNAKAFEFRPGAINFTPSGDSPSPQRSAAGLPTHAPQASFFDEREKNALGSKQGPVVEGEMNVIAHLQESELTDEQKKQLRNAGGVPQPYRTIPTWTVPDERLNTTFHDLFPKPQLPSQGPSPMHTPNPAGGQMPHSHQLPPHLHAPNVASASQHNRFFQPHQQHGMPHPHTQGFDPRMQFPGGPGNSVHSSPRFPQAQMAAFNGHVGQMPQMPMPQFAGQPMQGYGMSPNMSYRQLHMPPGGGPAMMLPGQPHGPMTQMRQPYPQGPPFAPNMQQMGGQMMVQQPSSGGYVNGPGPQQSFSPMPPHAQPQLQPMGQHPGGPGGYSSPRPTAHMMQPTGSHHGYQPQQQQQQQMQMPPYANAASQGPPHHGYPLAQRQMSHGQYPHMTPRQQQAMPVQPGPHVPSPGMGGPVQAQGDEGK